MSEVDPEVREKLSAMKEKELLQFISDTVERLNALGNRLEEYVRVIEIPKVGFATSVSTSTEMRDHDEH